MPYERDRNHDVLEFVIFCVENVADRLSADGGDVYLALKKSGMIDGYIIPSYDALHTQGKQYIVNDILDAMKERGVEI